MRGNPEEAAFLRASIWPLGTHMLENSKGIVL